MNKMEIIKIKFFKWVWRNLIGDLIKYSFLIEYTNDKKSMMDNKDNFINSSWFDGKENLRMNDITIIEELYG